MEEYEGEKKKRIDQYKRAYRIKEYADGFVREATRLYYPYNFTWMSRPIIQYPQDIIALHEIIWMVKPDIIIETGIAHGGSLVFSASMLALIEYEEAARAGKKIDPAKPDRIVVGVDIDIRAHNKKAIDAHGMRSRIKLIEGSSIDENIFKEASAYACERERVLVVLDSNHTHEHVLSELQLYANLVTVGSYCIVMDTVIEDLPAGTFPERPWDIGNNPKTAINSYLKKNTQFEIDKNYDNKLIITAAPSGYLKRVR